MDVDSTSLSGTWFRHIHAGGDVYYQPSEPADNRWQRGAVVEALYFADSEETAWAEWYRYLAEAALPPQQGLPRDLWRWEVSLPDVADLTDDDRLARVALPPLQPTRLQWPTFQPVGEQLNVNGWPALVSASAARLRGPRSMRFPDCARGAWNPAGAPANHRQRSSCGPHRHAHLTARRSDRNRP